MTDVPSPMLAASAFILATSDSGYAIVYGAGGEKVRPN